ncbi:MAG: Nramp family divalent metal transporter [Candidatus Acidiferrales bacterium]
MATEKVRALLAPLEAPRRRLRLWRRRATLLFAVVGPGLITATVNQDAGGIYSYSLAGAQFGYLLLWTVFPMAVVLYFTQEMGARLGAITGKGLSDLIREEFGFRTTFFLMLALLAVNLGNILAEFAGIAASLQLFGVSKYVSVPLAAVVIWAVVVRGSYRSVERVFLVGCLFYLSYVVSVVLAEPDWWSAAYHVVRPTWEPNSDYVLLVLALVGSTVAPWQFFYLQAGVVERNVPRGRYWETRVDVLAGSVSCAVIVFSIIVACAATLHRAGISQFGDAAAAAHALQPLAGNYAYILFAVGLLMASLLAASIVPLSTAYVICEGLGVEASLNRPFREAPIFYSLYTALLVVGAGLILLPGTPLVRVMVLSQVVNGFLLPVVLIFMLVLVNRRDLMGAWCNQAGANAIAWSTAVLMIALSLALLYFSFTGTVLGLIPRGG